ncbi:MAG: peptide chain release factor N(5)-glutamine methyltransferase [Flavitalea sp.]
MNIQEAKQRLLFQLYHLYDDREATGIADWVLEHLTGWSRIDRVINKDLPLNTQQKMLVEKYIAELSSHMPVQYVLNEAWFSGMKFFVNEDTLIPRPETEELVELVYKNEHDRVSDDFNLLDIGTGSGCIPISIKKKLSQANVISCDISEAAIEVAKHNAKKHAAEVQFKVVDFLDNNTWDSLPIVNAIVSNPPYIPLSDKESMGNNVVMYEPWVALFVENERPLVFYEAIAAYAQQKLHIGGGVYVETHENYAEAVADLFKSNHLTDVEIVKDMQEKNRFVKARKSI